jgi:hypothetical protein
MLSEQLKQRGSASLQHTTSFYGRDRVARVNTLHALRLEGVLFL